MRKKMLWIAMTLIMLTGVSFCAYPFIASMSPSAGAGADLPHVDVSSIQAGDMIFHDIQVEGRWSRDERYIIYRDYQDEFRVFLVLLREGQVNMPDLHWWREGHLCEDFRPEFQDGKVITDSYFKCHSSTDESGWYGEEWLWTLEGKSLGQDTDDMMVIDYSHEGRYLILHKG